MARKRIIMEPLSSFQKKDCLNRQGDYKCPNEATQEAVLEHDIFTARLRCCDDKKCVKAVKELVYSSLGIKKPKR